MVDDNERLKLISLGQGRCTCSTASKPANDIFKDFH
nr:MAG TPA_asm: hypothetical protein [Caudoviricetes sp.]